MSTAPTSPHAAATAAEVSVRGPALSARVIDAMYAEDPWWEARYGARARRHGGEDADFHVRYLAEALAAGDVAVMERYARWLRPVLCTRGMCTRHLEDNLQRLADALDAGGLPPEAGAYARAGAAALASPEGTPVRALADAGLVARVHAALPAAWQEAARRLPTLSAAHLASYLCDAVLLDRADVLGAQLQFLDGLAPQHGLPQGGAHALWTALHEALEGLEGAGPRSARAKLEESRPAPSGRGAG